MNTEEDNYHDPLFNQDNEYEFYPTETRLTRPPQVTHGDPIDAYASTKRRRTNGSTPVTNQRPIKVAENQDVPMKEKKTRSTPHTTATQDQIQHRR